MCIIYIALNQTYIYTCTYLCAYTPIYIYTYIFGDHVMPVEIPTFFWRSFPTSTSLPVEAVCDRAMAFAENNVTQKQILAGVYVGMIFHPCGK